MKKGFTLIEMLVALMIFSVVVVVALAALTKIIDANKKSQTIQNAVVNMSFSMESMTRELRTGSALNCVSGLSGDWTVPTSLSGQSIAPGCLTGATGSGGQGTGFAFLSNTSGGSCRLIKAYEIVPDGTTGTFIFKKASQTSCGAALSWDPVIDTAAMSINGYYLASSNSAYPLLMIKLDGTSGSRAAVQTNFTIQTAASSRIP